MISCLKYTSLAPIPHNYVYPPLHGPDKTLIGGLWAVGSSAINCKQSCKRQPRNTNIVQLIRNWARPFAIPAGTSSRTRLQFCRPKEFRHSVTNCLRHHYPGQRVLDAHSIRLAVVLYAGEPEAWVPALGPRIWTQAPQLFWDLIVVAPGLGRSIREPMSSSRT